MLGRGADNGPTLQQHWVNVSCLLGSVFRQTQKQTCHNFQQFSEKFSDQRNEAGPKRQWRIVVRHYVVGTQGAFAPPPSISKFCWWGKPTDPL